MITYNLLYHSQFITDYSLGMKFKTIFEAGTRIGIEHLLEY